MSLQTLQELLYFLIRRLGVRSRTRISYPVKAVRCWRSLLTRTLFTDLIRLYQSVPASTLTTRKQEDVYTELSLSGQMCTHHNKMLVFLQICFGESNFNICSNLR